MSKPITLEQVQEIADNLRKESLRRRSLWEFVVDTDADCPEYLGIDVRLNGRFINSVLEVGDAYAPNFVYRKKGMRPTWAATVVYRWFIRNGVEYQTAEKINP